MKKVAILTVLAFAGALATVACGDSTPPATSPGSTTTTTTTTSSTPADTTAPATTAPAK